VEDDRFISLHVTRGCVVAPVQVDLNHAVLMRLRQDILQLVRDRSAHGVVIDLTGVEVLDAHDWRGIRKTLSLAKLMGAQSILVGLSPGVVCSLVDMDVDVTDVRATLDLDSALDMLVADSEFAAASTGAEDFDLDDLGNSADSADPEDPEEPEDSWDAA
jgi:rsbT antagonist protein RsbS